MPVCEKCGNVTKTKAEIDREKLVKVLQSEIILSKYINDFFEKIGNSVLSLKDFTKFTSSFRLSKIEGKQILKSMEDRGMIEKKGGGNVSTRIRVRVSERK